MEVSPCPPEDDLLAFSSGDLGDAQRVTLLGHLAVCDECRVVTSELSKMRLGAAATAEHEEGLSPDVLGSRPSGAKPARYERPPFLAFAPGEVIAGKFKVVKVLGSGGMGVVIEAEHLLLERRVALKFMGPALVTDRDATARFFREARAASLIPNEHVVKILDVDMLEDGTPYIVMERLIGHDLATLLEREGRIEASRAVGYILEAMEALAHAHAKGIVHRDLKPANLFLAKREGGPDIVKVLDFGIAKAHDAQGVGDGDGAGMTTSQTVLGSPRYMAPEQMQSAKAADMRADIWALGTLLFELVSGRPAFEGETLAALSVAICTGPAPRLVDVFPSVPASLDSAVASCLVRALPARAPNVGVLARALAPLASASALVSIDRIAALFPEGRDEGGIVASSPPARAESYPPPPRASSGTPVLAIVGVLALGVGSLLVGLGIAFGHGVGSSPSGLVQTASALSALAPSLQTELPPMASSAVHGLAASASASSTASLPAGHAPLPGLSTAKRPIALPSALTPPPLSPLPRAPTSSTPYDERK